MKVMFHEVWVIKDEIVVFLGEIAFFDVSGGARLLKALHELAPDLQHRRVTVDFEC